jgi:hypothetical protein
MLPDTQYPAAFPFNSKAEKITRAAKNRDTSIGLKNDFITPVLINL